MNITQPSLCSLCKDDESLLKTKVWQSISNGKSLKHLDPRKSPTKNVFFFLETV